MMHYEIQYVVIEQNYLSNSDSREDYALIRLVSSLPISMSPTPTINFMKVPHRSQLQVIGFQKGGDKIEIAKLKMRNYECETAREPTSETDKLLCYQIRSGKVPTPEIDGAMIVDRTTSPFQLFGMHVKYYDLRSWYMKVGRAVNFAGEFYYWLQAAKFERLPQHIPSSKKLYCCGDATLEPYRQNKAKYGDRKLANVQNDGDPPLC